MKSTWRWIVPVVMLACGCRETVTPPSTPAASPVTLEPVGPGMGNTKHQRPGMVRSPGDDVSRQNEPTRARPTDPMPTPAMARSNMAPTTQPATRAIDCRHAVTVRRPGGDGSRQSEPTRARPTDPTAAPTASSTPKPIEHNPAVSISPDVPVATASVPNLPSRSGHVLDWLDGSGHPTQPASVVALPAVPGVNVPTSRPTGTFQVDFPAGQPLIADNPPTAVPLPANADEERQRRLATARQQRAEADRQAAQTLNDSLLRVLLAPPPVPPPAPATRPTLQLFAP